MKKRRFAFGGFSDIDEGRDTPDQAIARKAARLPAESVAKQAGLAATRGEDVGLKRFLMGNIDAPDSEASRRFGADKGVQMAEGAKARPVASVAAPVASVAAPIAAPRPAPVVNKPTVDLGEITDEAGTVSKFRRNTETGEAYDPGSATDKKPVAAKNRIVSKAELAKSGMSLRDFLNKERGLKRRPDTTDYEAALKSVAKGKATRESDMQIDSRKNGGSIKAYASGGSVSSRADGCAQRGKTKGMMR